MIAIKVKSESGKFIQNVIRDKEIIVKQIQSNIKLSELSMNFIQPI